MHHPVRDAEVPASADDTGTGWSNTRLKSSRKWAVTEIKCIFVDGELLLNVSMARVICTAGKQRNKEAESVNSPRPPTPTAGQMAIDGLIILDSANVKPIVQTSFRSFPPAYPLLHIDAYSTAIEKAARPEDVDPVLLVNLPDAPTACCHLQHRSLILLCPISGDRELFRSRYFTRICAYMCCCYL